MLAPRAPSIIAATTIGSRYRLIRGLWVPPVWIAATVMNATIAAAESAIRSPVPRTGNPRQRDASAKIVNNAIAAYRIFGEDGREYGTIA